MTTMRKQFEQALREVEGRNLPEDPPKSIEQEIATIYAVLVLLAIVSGAGVLLAIAALVKG